MGMRIYDKYKEIEQTARELYKKGCSGVSSTLFRDIELFERYEEMNAPKMERYFILSEDFHIDVSLVRAIVACMSKKI